MNKDLYEVHLISYYEVTYNEVKVEALLSTLTEFLSRFIVINNNILARKSYRQPLTRSHKVERHLLIRDHTPYCL